MSGHLTVVLAVLLALCTSGQPLQVTIRHSAQVLGFTLPIYDRTVGAVAFHYIVKHVEYVGRGVQTGVDWQFATYDISLDGADSVTAYAVIYDMDGIKRMTTQRSSVSLGDTSAAPVVRLPGRRMRGAVIFRDDFMSFSRGDWSHEVSMYGGYNGEFQVYTNDPKNVFTRNGNLYIKPIPTVDDSRFDQNFLHTGKMDMRELFGTCTEPAVSGCTREGKYGLLPPVMSGKLKSVPTLRYGIVEIRARIPQGDWIWPAIWMMPKYSRYGTWPRSGEIDIMESRGKALRGRTVSTRGDWSGHLTISPHNVDNQQIMRVTPYFWQKGGFGGTNLWANGEKMAPFDQEFYLILNVAVGGTKGFFPDGNFWGVRKPWANSSPHAAEDFWNGRNDWMPTWQGDKTAMIIDYVEFRNL